MCFLWHKERYGHLSLSFYTGFRQLSYIVSLPSQLAFIAAGVFFFKKIHVMLDNKKEEVPVCTVFSQGVLVVATKTIEFVSDMYRGEAVWPRP